MKSTIYKFLFIILLIFFTSGILKSELDTDPVLKAIKLEVDRSKEGLKKDSLAQPFFISLLVSETNFQYTYSTSFGKKNEEMTNTRISRKGNPLILVGSYHRTQNFRGSSNSFPLPPSDSEMALRSAIWMNLDNAYKSAAKNYVDKMAWLKQEKQTDEELALDDFEKRVATTYYQEPKNQKFDFEPIRKLSLKTSKLLVEKVKAEKLIVENLRTGFRFSNDLNRYYDTEGSMYKYPQQNGSFNITLSGVTKDGEDVSSYRSFRMNDLSKFPTSAELETAVNDVVEEYKLKFTTENSDEPYMGPVLIVNGQVENVVKQIINNLFTSPKNRFTNGNHYQNLSGVRVLSKQLSLSVHYGHTAQSIPGVKRDLAPIDPQAVIPPDSIILVQNGILKDMLTSRQPVKKFLKSNGNMRNGNLLEGVVTLKGNEQFDYEQIKKMLIEEARLQGLEFAYIVHGDDKLHLKVNVETGEEIPFIASINLGQTIKTMRRVMGVQKDYAHSTDGTIRFPKSILLEDAEITIYKSNNRKKMNFVQRPDL